jgi:hypothetical protein
VQHRRRLILALSASFAIAALAPFALAEQKAVRIDLGKQYGGGAIPSASFKSTKTPPDPPAMLEKAQWIYDLRYDRGDIWFVGAHKIDLPTAQATPRSMGRFALELYTGSALVERVRFDFPMLGAGESATDAGFGAAPSFEKKLRTRIGVMFPATARGTRLELWDRATDRRWELPWPPNAPPPAPANDGGAAQ